MSQYNIINKNKNKDKGISTGILLAFIIPIITAILAGIIIIGIICYKKRNKLQDNNKDYKVSENYSTSIGNNSSY